MQESILRKILSYQCCRMRKFKNTNHELFLKSVFLHPRSTNPVFLKESWFLFVKLTRNSSFIRFSWKSPGRSLQISSKTKEIILIWITVSFYFHSARSPTNIFFGFQRVRLIWSYFCLLLLFWKLEYYHTGSCESFNCENVNWFVTSVKLPTKHIMKKCIYILFLSWLLCQLVFGRSFKDTSQCNFDKICADSISKDGEVSEFDLLPCILNEKVVI